MDVLRDFLSVEVSSEEAYRAIAYFVESVDIRKGEYEGNVYIIKKMDNFNFILYQEYILQEGEMQLGRSMAISRDRLLRKLHDEAEKNGFILKGESNGDYI